MKRFWDRRTWTAVGLLLSLASLLWLPASAVIGQASRPSFTGGLPADCSRPVNRKWIDRVESIRWVAYSSPNTDPSQGYHPPTPEAITRDLLTLRKANFTGLITYGSAGIMGRQFLTIAQSLGYRGIIMGIWNPNAQDELENARNAANLPIVLGYGVGNEGLSGSRDRYSVIDLCAAISSLRAATGLPAATSEDIEVYYRRPELMTVGDWVFPISHPYWHFTKYAQDAIRWEADQYAALLERTRRFVFFKEVGLPSAGAYGLSEANQEQYYRGLAGTNVRFAYFEAFDQPSKDTSSVEPHWGIFHSDLEPKLLGWDLMGYRQFTPDRTANGQGCIKRSGQACTVEADGMLRVGDDLGSRHYSAALSFNTSGLPSGAVVTSIRLRVRSAGMVGNNPLKGLTADICRPASSGSGRGPGVELRIGTNCEDNVGVFGRTPDEGWYTLDFLPSAFPSINLQGITQIRLRLMAAPDAARAYLKFYSGTADTANSPVLLVRYSLP